MNQKIQDLMYHSGLTAQGCWDEMDEYDRKAIARFHARQWLSEHFGVK